ncbi:MAG: aa3-type cytochrome oxidase subunit IV [Chloroflexota bacterium]|nr:MAG: hypothetical protein DLM70_07655 [Chloroflexota bacterium]
MQSDELTRHDPAAGVPQAEHESHADIQHPEDEEHIHLPPPSIWPITMAFGIALGFAGLVFTLVVSFVGLFFAFVALVSWIQELRHESH